MTVLDAGALATTEPHLARVALVGELHRHVSTDSGALRHGLAPSQADHHKASRSYRQCASRNAASTDHTA